MNTHIPAAHININWQGPTEVQSARVYDKFVTIAVGDGDSNVSFFFSNIAEARRSVRAWLVALDTPTDFSGSR